MDKEKIFIEDFTLLNKTIGISVVELNTSRKIFLAARYYFVYYINNIGFY